jgi:hypothetical protein
VGGEGVCDCPAVVGMSQAKLLIEETKELNDYEYEYELFEKPIDDSEYEFQLSKKRLADYEYEF